MFFLFKEIMPRPEFVSNEDINRWSEIIDNDPSFPKDLKEYEIDYKYGKSLYKISIKQSEKTELYIDDKFSGTKMVIPLIDENKVKVIQANIKSR